MNLQVARAEEERPALRGTRKLAFSSIALGRVTLPSLVGTWI